jgi:hypothetical protein
MYVQIDITSLIPEEIAVLGWVNQEVNQAQVRVEQESAVLDSVFRGRDNKSDLDGCEPNETASIVEAVFCFGVVLEIGERPVCPQI